MPKEILARVEDYIDNEQFELAKKDLIEIDTEINKDYLYLAGYITAMEMKFPLDKLKRCNISFDITNLKITIPGANHLSEDAMDLINGFLHGALLKFEQATVPVSIPPKVSA